MKETLRSSKKILFILSSLHIGGMERMQVTLANALVKRGHEVTVMVLSPEAELRSELLPEVRFIYMEPKRHIGNRIPYIRHVFYDDGMWETRAPPKQLHAYYVGSEHYDVEIAFFRGMPVKIISGGAVSKKHCTTISRKSVDGHAKGHTDFDPEIVVRLAWVHTDFEKATGYRNNFKSMREVFNAYQSMDHVICVSNQAKEGFIKTIGDTGNLTTIYNMIPVEEVRAKAALEPEVWVKKAAFHVVLVGRLVDSAKGQKRLIHAVARLRREGHDISLALVGGGQDEDMLRKEISNLDAAGYITMTGSQRNPYPYIREADLLVCASYFEGFNLTVAESIIIGTPVLSTDCTGPNEILDGGKYGMIVENSEEGLYQGLKKTLIQPQLLEDYKAKSFERRSFFDEEKILEQIDKLFAGE